MSDLLELRNPHSVLAALQSQPKRVQKIVTGAKPQGAWQDVESLARSKGILVQPGKKKVEAPAQPQESGVGRSANTYALVKVREPLALEDVYGLPQNKFGVWLALDQLQDPQNLGSIFRSAAFFGIRGLIITRERSASLTSAVYDVASGGVEQVPFAIAPNLQRAFEKFKELDDCWILGTSEHAPGSLYQQKLDRHWLVVVGNEESGMRRLTSESCDVLCSIPAKGNLVTSLNVSVATGIILSHFASQ